MVGERRGGGNSIKPGAKSQHGRGLRDMGGGGRLYILLPLRALLAFMADGKYVPLHRYTHGKSAANTAGPQFWTTSLLIPKSIF